MIFIAFFIFTAAGQEAKYARVKQAFDGFTVQQAYSSSAYRLEPNYSLQQAQSMAMYTGQREFPVVEGDRLAGYLTGADLRNALRGNPAYVPVSMVMDRTIRPVTPDTGLFEVQQRLIEESKEGLPVVADSGSYVGMITLQHIADILRVAQTPPIIPGTPRA